MTNAADAIDYKSILNADAQPVGALPDWSCDRARCVMAYRHMHMMRAFDQKAVLLHRQGLIRTYPPLLGQEAIGIAAGFALEKEDVFCPYYRDHAVLWMRGVSLATLLTFWAGDEQGNDNPLHPQDLPIAIPIASQCTQGVGAAYALQLKKKNQAVLVSLGDGATSKGDFYEAINAAGVFNLPIVFLINNNQWAISTSRQKQTRARTLADKAVAAGIPSERVDGNDLFALSSVCQNALSSARKGNGPCLIEALTYRLGTHTTVEGDGQHPDPSARDKAWALEPCLRFRAFLVREHNWSDDEETILHQAIQDEIELAIQSFKARSLPGSAGLFDHVFASLHRGLVAQKAEQESVT
jgi:2-oxoisovalerate dehydrogenase E1 component alpha subunit